MEKQKPLAAAVRDWMERTDVRGDDLRLTVLTLLQFAGGLQEGANEATVSHASLSDMGQIMGRDERTIRRRLSKLKKLGYLSWIRRTWGQQGPNVYTIFSTGHIRVQMSDITGQPMASHSGDRTNESFDRTDSILDRTNQPSRPDTYLSNKGLTKGFSKGFVRVNAQCECNANAMQMHDANPEHPQSQTQEKSTCSTKTQKPNEQSLPLRTLRRREWLEFRDR